MHRITIEQLFSRQQVIQLPYLKTTVSSTVDSRYLDFDCLE